MTIAIGLLAKDGIVLATDSQESYGYMKAAADKILIGMGAERGVALPADLILWAKAVLPPRGSPMPGDFTEGKFNHHMAIGVAGAGNSVYVDSVSTAIRQIALDQKSDLSETEKAIQQKLIQFHAEHVIPFAHYPDDQRPDFDLLIAYGSNKFGDKLYRSHKSLLKGVPLYEAIGIGGFFAQNLLDKLYRYESVEYAKALAAYIIFQTKENVEGCGKNTRIWTIRNGRTAYVAWEKILLLEIEFRKFPLVEAELFSLVFGDLDEKEVSADLRKQARKLRSSASKIKLADGLP